MAEKIFTISYISFAMAAVFLILAVFFWIKFGVLRIIGDLSGRTAKKSIAKMREKNEKTGRKIHSAGSINVEHGKITDKMRDSDDLVNRSPMQNEEQLETGLLAENITYNESNNFTELLDNNATCILNGNTDEAFDNNATSILTENVMQVLPKEAASNGLTMIDEVIIIHTDEVI
jgi:hypothetical protein